MAKIALVPFVVLLGGAAVACNSDVGTIAPITPTLVAVSPKEFSGDVPCTNAPGAMRGYVATIFDVGTIDEPSEPFALPSSVINDGTDTYRPTPCERVAGFGFVIPGHRYDAEIDAYDRSDLHALGPGTRQLVDDASGGYVPPRWTTTCGRSEDVSSAGGPVTAAVYLTRFVHGCVPLVAAGDTPTGISVSLGAALDGLSCGAAPGSVSSFTASMDGQAPLSAQCAESVEFKGLEPGHGYGFEVRAYELGAPKPRWGTSCFRTALAGAIVAASCDPLTELTP